MQVGPANATRTYAKENVPWLEFRFRNLANSQWVFRNILR